MAFKLDANGIDVTLNIKGYKHGVNDYSDWCKCDFSFISEGWLNYHKENDEVLLSSEVDELINSFSELLSNEIVEEKEIVCIEPDFIFQLYPQKDLTKDPKYTYVQPGYEIMDIFVEWNIYFWNVGLTKNHLTITLYRDDILKLRDYLVTVTKQVEK